MTHALSPHIRAFSLLEMSIVIIIIGLIVGGVMATNSLVDSSRLQSTIADVDYYTSAINNFKTTYSALPGDFAGATTLWSAAHGTPATCKTTVGTGTATCDGDGNGKIGNGVSSTDWEAFGAWKHLVNGGFLKDRYTGVVGTTIGTQFPKTAIRGAGWNMVWLGTMSSDTNYYDGNYGNVLLLGAPRTSNYTRNAILTPSQAEEIDRKTDDGYPAAGRVRATKHNSTVTAGCTSNAATPLYVVATTTQVCALVFSMGF